MLEIERSGEGDAKDLPEGRILKGEDYKVTDIATEYYTFHSKYKQYKTFPLNFFTYNYKLLKVL
jgi:hypothetical protein